MTDFASPIERFFAAALFSELSFDPLPLVVHPQAPVGPYFADFLLTLGEKRVAVECDGREFHSSPPQLEHDRKRDEFFMKRGIATLRFSGSQIHGDGASCVREAIDALLPAYIYVPPTAEETQSFDAECRARVAEQEAARAAEKAQQDQRWAAFLARRSGAK